MQAGKLKDYVSLQEPTTVQDGIGQQVPGWVEVTKLWANIRFQSGVEVVKADAPTSVARVSIQIRKRAGVKANMQIVDADSITYRIDAVLPDKLSRDRINLVCEVVSG